MDDIIIGEVRLAGFEGIPEGWAACDGQALAIDEHRALFDVIGTTYGGDGRKTFALPDLRGRVAVHADGDAFRLGAAGGADRHALASGELPEHQHELLLATPATNGSAGDGVSYLTDGPVAEVTWTVERQPTTRGAGHDNMQPYLGLTFMIALGGPRATRR
ncbi:MAG TPA: tail fiber protein [Thermomicrobiales bacterium]|mgnify:CR=1 FL=1|nr:tail fiber protein [Thermomicrobiales bacterium]